MVFYCYRSESFHLGRSLPVSKISGRQHLGLASHRKPNMVVSHVKVLNHRL